MTARDMRFTSEKIPLQKIEIQPIQRGEPSYEEQSSLDVDPVGILADILKIKTQADQEVKSQMNIEGEKSNDSSAVQKNDTVNSQELDERLTPLVNVPVNSIIESKSDISKNIIIHEKQSGQTPQNQKPQIIIVPSMPEIAILNTNQLEIPSQVLHQYFIDESNSDQIELQLPVSTNQESEHQQLQSNGS